MTLQAGDRLGPYEVIGELGAGGMGVVLRARDTTLDRDVALKVLPEAFTADPDRLGRFEREAKVLASLNHANIGQIYGLERAPSARSAGSGSTPSDVEGSAGSGQAGDSQALVLELVEGPTLADRIAAGPISVDETLAIATQIAEALEAAHEQGVIHRDLKPANVKVRPDGTVKVLDFGLAKAMQPDASDPGVSLSPTISLTAAATQMGMVIGTAAYMAPEQAKGKPVDRRADVWAFGAVVYEMLTGRRAFGGEDVSDTLAAVLRAEVELDRLGEEVPARLRQVLGACLQRDPKQRVHDIADVRLALGGAFETTAEAAIEPHAVASLRWWQRPLPLAAVVMTLLVITGAAVWILTRPAPRPLARFVLPTAPDGPLRSTGGDPYLTISPDGTRVVYASGIGADRRLYIRELGELEATPLRGGEGGYAPFFSPDGQSVGFRAVPGDLLKRVSVLGGPAVTIVEPDAPQGVTWSSDDTILFGGATGLMRVPAVGGEPEQLTSVDPEQGEVAHRFPEVLPNGNGVLFTAFTDSVEESRLAVFSLETGAVSYLLTGGSFARYSPTGHLVYAIGGTLRAVGFDPDRLELTTDNPVPVVEDVNTLAAGAGNFALGDNGSLVYVRGSGSGLGAPRSLVWVDRDGREEPLETPQLPYRTPSISPDGTEVAVDVLQPDNAEIWIHDLERGTETTLTSDPGGDRGPLWTLNGQHVVFSSDRDGGADLFQKRADTPEDAVRLTTGGAAGTFKQPTSWSADGQTLLFYEVVSGRGDIGQVSMDGDGAPRLLLETEFNELVPAVSPGGEWLAYESDVTGEREIYVQRFPGLGGRQTISTDGGRQPLWSRDGSELFYRGPRGMMAVPVLESGAEFRAGAPEVLFDTPYYIDRGTRTYDVAADRRFLMVKEAPAGAAEGEGVLPTEIVLVENWFAELERLVPVP